MTFKPETKDYKDKRTEWLHRKWGMENPNANASLEQTRKMIMEMILMKMK